MTPIEEYSHALTNLVEHYIKGHTAGTSVLEGNSTLESLTNYLLEPEDVLALTRAVLHWKQYEPKLAQAQKEQNPL